MKTQKKLFCSILIASAILAIIGFTQQKTVCCICNSFRYHAPCLVDLDEGRILELDLYYPHETKVAELADPQPEMGTFSFVRMGNVSGTKFTDSKTVDLRVPFADKVYFPSLCKNCRNTLDSDYRGRYALADLYDMNNKTIIPIVASNKILDIRCYRISMILNDEKEEITVTIQGVLDTDFQKVMED